MVRLLEDDQLKVSSVQAWKALAPKIYTQAHIESGHSSRLRTVLEDTTEDDKGNMHMYMYTVL